MFPPLDSDAVVIGRGPREAQQEEVPRDGLRAGGGAGRPRGEDVRALLRRRQHGRRPLPLYEGALQGLRQRARGQSALRPRGGLRQPLPAGRGPRAGPPTPGGDAGQQGREGRPGVPPRVRRQGERGQAAVGDGPADGELPVGLHAQSSYILQFELASEENICKKCAHW